ncbi:hypothetical protein, partial [Escherichia coli]|uniref:hypothetical protein n=1 Tax=Escherichia coli TaxID=562 RepID=UPI003D091393
THKSIDALLASTMFLLFTMVTPHYEDIAKKIGFFDNAYAIANSSTSISASSTSVNTKTSDTTVQYDASIDSSMVVST